MSVVEIGVVFAASVVGFAMFRYGKKRSRGPHLGGGVLLMAYPYFVSGLPWLCVVFAVIVAAVWLSARAGF